jgi:hypothetical protein
MNLPKLLKERMLGQEHIQACDHTRKAFAKVTQDQGQELCTGRALNRQMKRFCLEGWRDGSVLKSINCSSRGPEFNSQQPHGGSQSSVMVIGCHLLLCLYSDIYKIKNMAGASRAGVRGIGRGKKVVFKGVSEQVSPLHDYKVQV